MELTDIRGVGPTKAERLKDAGIETVQDLATIDLRKPVDVNIGRDVLKRAKQDARKALLDAGIPFEKAAYRQAATTVAPRPARGPKTAAAPPKEQAIVGFRSDADAVASPAGKKQKRGILSRILNRA